MSFATALEVVVAEHTTNAEIELLTHPPDLTIEGIEDTDHNIIINAAFVPERHLAVVAGTPELRQRVVDVLAASAAAQRPSHELRVAVERSVAVEKLYVTRDRTRCHAIAGEGETPFIPEISEAVLDEVGAWGPREYINAVVTQAAPDGATSSTVVLGYADAADAERDVEVRTTMLRESPTFFGDSIADTLTLRDAGTDGAALWMEFDQRGAQPVLMGVIHSGEPWVFLGCV